MALPCPSEKKQDNRATFDAERQSAQRKTAVDQDKTPMRTHKRWPHTIQQQWTSSRQHRGHTSSNKTQKHTSSTVRVSSAAVERAKASKRTHMKATVQNTQEYSTTKTAPAAAVERAKASKRTHMKAIVQNTQEYSTTKRAPCASHTISSRVKTMPGTNR
jgi:hypothetical protein